MNNQLEIIEPVVKWIDLFCGAGGTSSGIIAAGDHVLACVNHDEGAILSHKLNHPEVLHMIEDIRTLDLSILIKLVEKERRENPDALIGLWASLDAPTSVMQKVVSPAMQTLIARMDKAPPYLVTTENGHLAIAVYETDSSAMIKIKEFMAQYGIADIFMRMLRIPELLRIQGFPVWYFRNLLEKKKVTQGQIKKYIGNSVEVNQARALISAIRMTFMNIKKMTA